MNSWGCFLLAAVLLPFWIVSGLRAEVFMLANGGRVTGELVNRDEKPRRNYVIRVEGEGRITLPINRVLKVLPNQASTEYEKNRPRYPDTVEAQWALAEWCRENHLDAPRDRHLQRIIELDPEHAQARRLLGYSKVNGEWSTRDDLMRQRGYQLYKGRWMLPQQIELLKEKEKLESAQQEWFGKIKRWRGWLGTDRDSEARQAFSEVDNPAALEPLVRGLRDDGNAGARLLFVEALAKIGDSRAADAMAIAALGDPDREVRLTCLDHLQTKPHPEVVKYFINKLKKKDNSNETINRIGFALGRMKDPSATGPLIDALVTKHKFQVPGGGSGGVAPSFGSGPGGGGASMTVGSGPKYITRQIPNQSVLDALIAITGQNFSYDQRAWKSWLAAQRKSGPPPAARRD